MNQDLVAQQDATAFDNSSSFSTTKGFATGTVCQSSGTYRASNRYMDVILLYAVGEVFLPGPDGKKTTWYALSSSLSTNSSGSFSSVKVAAGTL